MVTVGISAMIWLVKVMAPVTGSRSKELSQSPVSSSVGAAAGSFKVTVSYQLFAVFRVTVFTASVSSKEMVTSCSVKGEGLMVTVVVVPSRKVTRAI